MLFLNPDADAESKDADFAMRTNCLTPFLLTHLLYPLMHHTATHFCLVNTSIRIVYVSSLINYSTPHGGVQLVPAKKEERWEPNQLSGIEGSMQSKAGVCLLAHEFARKHKAIDKVDEHGMRPKNTAGVLHVCVDLGAFKTLLPASMRGLWNKLRKGEEYGESQ